MNVPWFVKKPFRWACHQIWGGKKGEIIYLQHVGKVGELFSRVTPDELEALLDLLLKEGEKVR